MNRGFSDIPIHPNAQGWPQMHLQYHYSPVENQNDLELDFKVYFFVDSCCWGTVFDESNWCHSGIFERFEIFKMASKMAVS